MFINCWLKLFKCKVDRDENSKFEKPLIDLLRKLTKIVANILKNLKIAFFFFFKTNFLLYLRIYKNNQCYSIEIANIKLVIKSEHT